MKLSFSLSTKPPSKHQSNLVKPSQTFNTEDQNPSSAIKEYVTEFNASKTLADAQAKKRVIPPKPNKWRLQKKMKNLDLPKESDDPNNLQFEVDLTSVAEPKDSNTSYGLNLRQSSKNDVGEDTKLDGRPLPRSDPIRASSLYKNDLNRCPEDLGFDEFNDTPVEGFGAALLAGYGWYEGRGIGRNAKEDVKTVQYERRTAKERLGFFGDMPPKSNNGNTKVPHKKKGEEEHNNKVAGRYYVGKDVSIVGGRDLGSRGRIVELIDGGSVVLKLLSSEEEIKVHVRDVAELGSIKEERCLKKLKELKIRGSKDEMNDSDGRMGKESYSGRSHRESRDGANWDKTKDSKKSRQEGDQAKESRSGRSHRESRDGANQDKIKDGKRSREGGDQRVEKKSTQVSWLTSNIRVRIISKELKGGRLYLKKAVIMDVVGPTMCDISMDDSRELIQVDQELLETALPRRGGPVLVLYGRHKGVYGSLVERDMKNETGVVQDADTHALLTVRLEQIAEYVGDPSYIGY